VKNVLKCDKIRGELSGEKIESTRRGDGEKFWTPVNAVLLTRLAQFRCLLHVPAEVLVLPARWRRCRLHRLHVFGECPNNGRHSIEGRHIDVAIC